MKTNYEILKIITERLKLINDHRELIDEGRIEELIWLQNHILNNDTFKRPRTNVKQKP